MPVVADATPLNTLIRLGLVNVLSRLYGQVIIPPAVQAELSHPRAPKELIEWAEAMPSWVLVRSPTRPEEVSASGAGEREAIALAIELQAELLLADDKEARAVARRRGLAVIGTIGILELAAASGWVELESALDRLRQVGFYVDDEVLRLVLRQHHARLISQEGQDASLPPDPPESRV
jgi:predicted nucleic acid-binding protein